MPVLNRIADFQSDIIQWRRALHQIPELGFDCPKTSSFIATRLREFGVDELHQGIAQTGIVAIINGAQAGDTIGLRADFDGLAMEDRSGKPHASTHPGQMHGCGHDGHTAMLLGAARYLAETRSFSGRVALIFQPAEEGGGGAKVMCEEGIMDRFKIREVYGFHNVPGLEHSTIHTRPGPLLAAVDSFEINVTGRGGHGGMPHETKDPLVAACGIVQAIQTIVSRNLDPQRVMALSVTQVHTGSTSNVIPDTAFINGTIRTFDPEVKTMVQKRLAEVVEGQAVTYGCQAQLSYIEGYPATVNDPDQVDFAAQAAREVVGDDRVNLSCDKVSGSEDFSYMLQERPGAFLFLGTGEGPKLHHPEYDFDDTVSVIGASIFARLIERGLS
ncbi:M20 aminoacylase family protein [Pseudophaeobacter sp.]|uniref:M20 aminoacylase family protein n=1 Tax=Pseudophaeobacter sp. TaxID=1971739 RepID=UPI003299A62F